MTISVSYQWSGGASPLNRFSALRALTGWADDVGPAILQQLKDDAPVYQAPAADPNPRPGGRLRDSQTVSRKTEDGSLTLSFAAHTPYATYVRDGTLPHVIAARAARALRFYDDLGVRFAPYVLHPGTAANPWPRHVMDRMHDEIMSNLAGHIADEL